MARKASGSQKPSMEQALPPEKVVSKAAMAGKDGKPVEWQEWKAGQPCPLARVCPQRGETP